jgi:uncharacterized coiled-coil protein SlyX
MIYLEKRIGELEDTLKQRDRQIADLRRDLDEQSRLIGRLREKLQERRELTERWIDAFDLEPDDKGGWKIPNGWRKYGELWQTYESLQKKWNAIVPEFNAVVAPRRRNFGRPLLASPAQQDDVRARRKRGESLRAIAEDTALGLQTVRTILDKADGTDRATMARLQRLAPDKFLQARMRRGIRAREVITKQIAEFQATSAALIKQAKGL